TARSRPVTASHKRIVRSLLPLARSFPLGLQATAPTLSPCPRHTSTSRPVDESSRVICRESPVRASRLPDGSKLSPVTSFPSRSHSHTALLVSRFQARTRLR